MSFLKTYQHGLGASTLLFTSFILLALKFNSDLLMVLSAIGMCLLGIIIYLFKAEKIIYKVLLFSLLFSLEIPLLASSKLSFPDELLIVLLSIVSTVHLIWNEQFMKYIFSTSLSKIILLHAFVYIVSSFFSSMPIVSAKFSFINILYMICGVVTTVYLLQNKKLNFKSLVHFFTIPLFFICLYTIVHFAPSNFSSQASITMAQPFFKDHTLLSACLSLFVPLYIFYPFIYPKTALSLKIGAFTMASLLLFIIFISSSRAAWLSLVLGICFYIFILFRGNFKGFLSLLGLTILLSIAFSGNILDRLNLNSNSSGSEYASLGEQFLSSSNIHNDVSNLERLNRWKCAIRMAKDHPIIGFGPGTYQFEYLPYQLEKDKTPISVNNPFNTKQGYGGSAHSEYFLVLSEMGILGLFTWVFLLLITIYSYFKIRESKIISLKNKLISDAIVLSLITFFGHSLFNNFLNTAKTAIPFWILIGFLLYLTLKLKHHEKGY